MEIGMKEHEEAYRLLERCIDGYHATDYQKQLFNETLEFVKSREPKKTIPQWVTDQYETAVNKWYDDSMSIYYKGCKYLHEPTAVFTEIDIWDEDVESLATILDTDDFIIATEQQNIVYIAYLFYDYGYSIVEIVEVKFNHEEYPRYGVVLSKH